MSNLYDVTIIGAGPVGLFTTFYSGLRSLKTKIIDAEPAVGGKIRYFYPEKIIRDIGGIPAIEGQELVKNLHDQAKTFQPTIVCGERITEIHRQTDGTFQLTAENGNKHYSKTIIIAAGSGTYEVHQLEVSGSETFANNLFYDIKNLASFQNKAVVVSGGGNAAIDWAQALEPIAKEVHLIYRGENFKGHEERVKEMHDSSIYVHVNHEITALQGDSTNLRNCVIHCNKNGNTIKIDTDAIVVNHGVKVNLGSMLDWGFDTSEYGILVNQEMETSVPGIYACGDICTYPRKMRIIAAGLHEGPIAINSAKNFLDPDAEEVAMVSTHHESFTEV
ncbi:NAD(P)/FAD-dependent oxidoreductase [Listeria cornellensis]|uniref:Ferredoxin--NADP reductase n=1 Tax=Listeria cornellensis FSL F6-0969 TaxID=1265820 RepID=W7BW77_9LIST|nr:NAD(P)/FAD-dependent oxidoreductase [Listeria cornellensis]EUJ31034.1 pyridine nucleotide-disulfide oxidoreductase [Listeria cornellensis FSL F6-0969]